MKLAILSGAAATLLLAPSALAQSATVDNLGGDVVMNAGTINVLNNAPTDFSEIDLGAIHTELNNDGIATDGYFTFLLVNTGADLTFISLFDNPNSSGAPGLTSMLGMTSIAPSTATGFINDDGFDASITDLGNGSQSASGVFSWEVENEGDGFAWGALETGDSLTYFFDDQGVEGVAGSDVFQFLSFDAVGGWSVVATDDFSANDQLVFSLETLVPAPGALALLGLAGLVSARRRRN